MNFLELMDNHGGILIPKIQREYAQGRLDDKSTSIREGFVQDIWNALTDDNKKLSVDFIYGMKEKSNGKEPLMPLDGQQRLTTLLLFAWYCGKTERDWIFNYESRRVSQCFIKGLLAHPHDVKVKNVHDEITQSSWFLPAWAKDPTISGMFEMLGQIEKTKPERYKELIEKNNGWNNITFESLDIFERQQLTDPESSYGKLFLKMNARGLPLNDWENLKALLDKYYPGDEQSEEKKNWTDNVDNTWPENIFKIIGDSESLEEVESKICVAMEKIVRIAFARVGINYNSTLLQLSNKFDNAEDYEIKISFYRMVTSYFDALSSDFVQCWSQDRTLNSLWNNYNKNKCNLREFKDFICENPGSTSFNDQLRFAYLVEYEHRKDKDEHKQRLRVLLNLLDNTTYFDRDAFSAVIEDGINFLNKKGKLGSLTKFNRRQLHDEQIKWNKDTDEIIKMETNPLVWHGSLSFLHSDTEDADLDRLKNNLNFLQGKVEADPLKFFCMILKNLTDLTMDKNNDGGHLLKSTVQVPEFNDKNNFKIKRSFAKYVFSNEKKSLSSAILQTISDKNDYSFFWTSYWWNEPKVDTRYAFICHLYEICSNPKYLVLVKDLQYLQSYAGWNYFKRERMTPYAIRLAYSKFERSNIETLGRDVPYLYRYNATDRYLPDNNGEIWYLINETNTNWYMKEGLENQDQYHHNEETGEYILIKK